MNGNKFLSFGMPFGLRWIIEMKTGNSCLQGLPYLLMLKKYITQEEIDYAVSVMAEVIPMLRRYTRR